MELKHYQSETLSTLRRFLEEARVAGPRNAYETITQEPEQAERLGRYASSYKPLDTLPDVPYVCLRLPTGGGKTILGAYSVAIARDAWIEKDYPLVLWLAPSNIIRVQTVEALNNPRHPYRQTLDEAFAGRVRVFDIANFTHIRPPDLRNHCCIVVGTIQTLRVSVTEGRKVYAHNEDMEPHFSMISKTTQGLEKLDNGEIKFSFVNLLHLHRPLMIVDEAHNAVTGLTREMQTRVNPCAIIEFTATPRDENGHLLNNILHSVTARELKLEEMIKLPVMLDEHETWQSAVNGAIAIRASLAKAAQHDTDYIRPIVLFQAQPRDQEVTVEILKTYLKDAENIDERKIAVATGDQRELDGIDLFDPQCPIEYVITVEALKEGWDCSFAYVFCSVSRIQSTTAIEQLLGRVLRMPYARRRKADALNKAYAHLSEPDSGETARALVDKLISMGFEEEEAIDSIKRVQPDLYPGDNGGLFSDREPPKPVFKHTVTATPEILSILKQEEGGNVTTHETNGGKIEIAITGHVDEHLEELICTAIPETERQSVTKAITEHRVQVRDQLSPSERGESFKVPSLMSEIQGELLFADTDLFMESHDWSLFSHAFTMDENEFAIRETAHSFEIDIDGNQIKYQYLKEEQQLALNVDVEGWTSEVLILWLDREVHEQDLLQTELLKWLEDLVHHLLTGRMMHLSALMRCKFILARKIRNKIDDIRNKERNNAYQRNLLNPEAKITVSFENVFSFKDGMYQDQRCYRGNWKPGKHFLGANHVPAFDGQENGEEVQCAQAIDSLDEVKFWIRNISRHPESFWLPTATDKFYPDFVAQLNDERLLVVEYKGAHIADSADTREKRVIGELWQRESNGMGLFIVVEKEVDGKNMRDQIKVKIA